MDLMALPRTSAASITVTLALLTHLLTYSVTYLPAVAASDPAFYTYLLNHLTNLPIYLLA